jgi:hypothetical protein
MSEMPQSLKDFARNRFRREADQSANIFAFGRSREAVREYINANPCRQELPMSWSTHFNRPIPPRNGGRGHGHELSC